jgi:hypothetical protein
LGLPCVSAGEWLAFVDDDDTLATCYIDALQSEVAATPGVNVVVFRMITPSNVTIPPPHFDANNAITFGYVGISFAFKRELFTQGFRFVNSRGEDFELVSNLTASVSVRPNISRVAVLSPSLTYYIKTEPRDCPSVNDARVADRVVVTPK